MTLDEAQKQIEQLQAKLHCMCGDSADHSCWAGHSPVSMYDYALDQAEADVKRLRLALEDIVKDGPIWRAQRIAREALVAE